MNEISEYLETMFRPYPQTPRLREAKAELHGMMEDAYAGLIADGATPNEAMVQIVSDFGSLDELALTLGITADLEPRAGGPVRPSDERVPVHAPISMDEAKGFTEAHRRTAPRLGAGVALYVLAAIPLVLLLGASDQPAFPLDAGVAIAIGLVLALALGAIATVTIVRVSGAFAPFARIQERRFSPDANVIRWVNEVARANERRQTRSLTVGVLLWVLSPAALIIVVLAPPTSLQSVWIGASTAFLLLVVAIGLFVFLRETWASSAAGAINRGVPRTATVPV